MKINSQTKVSALIKHNKEAIDAIASLNQHFKKLKNPILRAVLAPRITLEDASKIGKCDLSIIFKSLENIGFVIDNETITKETAIGESSLQNLESFIEGYSVHTLDVRPFIAKGEDPFTLIMNEVRTLKDSYIIEIINSFEPIPLIRILEKKGNCCLTICEEDIYHTYIKREGLEFENTIEPVEFVSLEEYTHHLQHYGERIISLDVREMEMPIPMVMILNALEDLEEGFALKVFHKKVPQYLLPELKERNFKTIIHEVEEGKVMMLIFI